jgi:hypothetical protein
MTDSKAVDALTKQALIDALLILDGAFSRTLKLFSALKELIPSPGSLSPEKHALWHEVVNTIYDCAEYSEMTAFKQAEEIVRTITEG